MDGDHPYSRAPRTAFWSRAVATGWDPRELCMTTNPLIRASDAIMSAGSCFAANTIPYLQKAGFNYLKLEEGISVFGEPSQDRFGYAQYSAAYGNIYTPRQLLQLLRRSLGRFKPIEDRWPNDDVIIDPFRPGLPFPGETDTEFDLLTSTHLEKTRAAFEAADVFIFTLGLTESWMSVLDGAVFPSCPGTIAGSFDPQRHVFKNFSVVEITADLDAFIGELRQINSKARIILTVSPVPLVATATSQHVLTASTYSKSVLRVACEEIVHRHSEVLYFPAYEIIVGAKSSQYFEDDRRNVNRAGVETVVDVLFSHCEVPNPPALAQTADNRDIAIFSQAVAKYECEEMMMDPKAR
jgi:GSCFA family